MGHGGLPWMSDFNHPHYMAGRKAMKTGNKVYIHGLPVVAIARCDPSQ